MWYLILKCLTWREDRELRVFMKLLRRILIPKSLDVTEGLTALYSDFILKYFDIWDGACKMREVTSWKRSIEGGTFKE
jgi:hypothetical protein